MSAEQLHCDACGIDLPNAASLESHLAGKKHSIVSMRKSMEAELCRRSVFLTGLNPAAVSVENIRTALAVFGIITDIKMNSKKTTAIVEFEEASVAETILKQKKLMIGERTVVAKPREIQKQTALKSPNAGSGRSSSSPSSPYAAVSSPPSTSDRFNEDANGSLSPTGVSMEIDSDENPTDAFKESLTALLTCDNVESQAIAFAESQLMTDPEKSARCDLARQLENLFKSFIRCPELSVDLIGSSRNGFGVSGCDLDVTLVLPPDAYSAIELPRTKTYLMTVPFDDVSNAYNKLSLTEIYRLHSENKYDCMRLLSRLLKNADSNSTTPFLVFTKAVNSKRCPLIHVETRNSWPVDVSLSNHAALKNTEFFRKLADADPRFPHLFAIVRLWARHRCDMSRTGQLGNYALLLMVLVYLQHNKYVSSLRVTRQDAACERISVDDTGYDFSFPEDLRKYCHKQTTPVSSLLQGFFAFCTKMTFSTVVLSPLEGKVMPLKEFQQISSDCRTDKFKFGTLNIQDPFVLDHNTAASVSKANVKQFIQECDRALKLCSTETFVVTGSSPWGLPLLWTDYGACPSTHVSLKWAGYLLELKEGQEMGPSLLRLFTEILGFNFSGNEFTAKYKTWIGRRKRQKKAAAACSGDALAIERAITSDIMQESRTAAPLLTFRLRYYAVRSMLLVQIFLVNDAEQDFADLCHFLELFLVKVMPLV